MSKKKAAKKKVSNAEVEENHDLLSHHYHKLDEHQLSIVNADRKPEDKLKPENVSLLVLGNHEDMLIVSNDDRLIIDTVLGNNVWPMLKKKRDEEKK